MTARLRQVILSLPPTKKFTESSLAIFTSLAAGCGCVSGAEDDGAVAEAAAAAEEVWSGQFVKFLLVISS